MRKTTQLLEMTSHTCGKLCTNACLDFGNSSAFDYQIVFHVANQNGCKGGDRDSCNHHHHQKLQPASILSDGNF